MARVSTFLTAFVLFFTSFALSAKPKYPLRFLENKGQFDVDILYSADIPSGKMYLKKDRIIYKFIDFGNRVRSHDYSEDENEISDPLARQIDPEDPIKFHVYEVLFTGSSGEISVVGMDQGTERYNYFTGSDRSKWAQGVNSFGLILYNDIYNGIDLKIYSTNSGLKYDFMVSPGADPSEIQKV